MKLNFGSSSKAPAIGAQDGSVCPYCNRESITASQAHPRTSLNHDRAERLSSPKLSLQEALQSLPDYEVPTPSSLDPEQAASKHRPLTGLLKDPQLIIPMVQKKTKSIWARTHTHSVKPLPPNRPIRPPSNQCPSDQPFFAFSRAQVFPDLPQLIPQLPEIATVPEIPPFDLSIAPLQYSIPAQKHHGEVAQSSTANTYCDVACGALTRDRILLRGNLERLEAQTDDPQTRAYQDEVQRTQDTPDKNVGTRYPNLENVTFCGSFSTLPSTVSKVALKPSPLRLAKGPKLEIVPPLPIRSPLRTMTAGLMSDPFDRVSRSSRITASIPHRSSYDTLSVYSTDGIGHTTDHVDTPPSSPPPTSPHQKFQSSLVEMDAYTRAEGLRNELGIIDDTYAMYTDTDKHFKHEACIDELGTQKSFLQPPSRVKSEKFSRTQRRLQKQQARDEAAGKLEGSGTDIKEQEADFGQWLDRTPRLEMCKNCSRIDSPNPNGQHFSTRRDSQRCFFMTPNDESDVLSEDRQQLDLTYKHSDEEDVHSSDVSKTFCPLPSIKTQNAICFERMSIDSLPTPPKFHADYRHSLAILQKQLQALMQENTYSRPGSTNTASTAASEEFETSPSTSPQTCSASNDGIEYGPKDLQRIEIEWRGKRYPVLIGERGRIWEGPCTDVYCNEHWKLGKELAYGMI